jgi:hypothetical protein
LGAKESEMEAFKNMEVLLMLSFGLVCGAACLYRPAAPALAIQASALALPAGPMPVVVITAKRLSAAEKRGETVRATANERAG